MYSVTYMYVIESNFISNVDLLTKNITSRGSGRNKRPGLAQALFNDLKKKKNNEI